MLARCGRAAHICKANRNCTINENKNLRENRKESQLPSKSEGCNERYGFRGNCDSQGKLGMCPSLAESLAVGFSRNHVSRETMYKNKLFLEHWLQILSRRQIKVFCSNNFSKMLARCGRAAHICEANLILQSVFPAAIAFLKAVQFK